MTTASNNSPPREIDKRELYGEFLRGRREDRNLMLKVARKAMDIDEDVNVQANRTGIGALGIAGIVAAAGLGPLALAAAMFFKQPAVPTEPSKPTATVIEKVWDSSVDMIVEPPQE